MRQNPLKFSGMPDLSRLAEAKRLLLKTDLNVKEIAARTGFCAPNYLIKKFKAATGCTPLKWEKRTSL